MDAKSSIVDADVVENNSQESKNLNDLSYPKSMRLLTRIDYRSMNRSNKQFTGKWIVADIRLTRSPFSRLGITVTKKFGKAVQRNRFKRLARESFRSIIRRFPFSCDILIRPRTLALKASKDQIQQELLSFLESVYDIS